MRLALFICMILMTGVIHAPRSYANSVTDLFFRQCATRGHDKAYCKCAFNNGYEKVALRLLESEERGIKLRSTNINHMANQIKKDPAMNQGRMDEICKNGDKFIKDLSAYNMDDLGNVPLMGLTQKDQAMIKNKTKRFAKQIHELHQKFGSSNQTRMMMHPLQGYCGEIRQNKSKEKHVSLQKRKIEKREIMAQTHLILQDARKQCLP